MSTNIPQLVVDVVSGIAAFEPLLAAIEAEWQPDPAPPTTSLADVGRELVERIDEIGRDNAALVFQRIEHVLSQGSERDKDAVATGFLEAVVGAIDRAPEREWVLQLAGPHSRDYVTAWDRFNGIERPRWSPDGG
ncbi:MAG TPA: hypothetical protein VFS67_09690 [Polyangiaceae bacterium]|nr:hypothetical protein [Polyangiaceae bacterium]